MLTSNNLLNACNACLLYICTEYTINPNELTDLDTGNPLNLSDLSNQMVNQLSNHHYIALYFNRDEPTIYLEKATSHEDLLDLYEIIQDDFYAGDSHTMQITIDNINYTIDLLADI